MEEPVLSSSESVLSTQTESMEEMEEMELSVLENSPPRSATPLNDTFNSLDSAEPLLDVEEADAENIVVHPPTFPVEDPTKFELEDEDDEEVITPQKRKRAPIKYIFDGDASLLRGSPTFEPAPKRSKLSTKIRGVLIGVWRDSDQPDDADKHVIYGFIDIHDRLRTRIYGMNRRGQEVIGNVPTGAGGCWVTFERIIFDSHLKPLNAAEIKEYVKIRADMKPDTNEEEKAVDDAATVIKAKATVVQQEASPGGKPVMHRPHAVGRHSLNRQSLPGKISKAEKTLHKTPSFQAVNAADMPTPKASPFSEGKPLGVLLGFWNESQEERDEDKHAVFGVLGNSDCFRVKVARQTRDGRYVDGNYPIGAGAMWLHYDKVILEPYLRHLTRAEVKEYCRIRQKELEYRETDKERRNNELNAVKRAKQVVADLHLNGANNVDMDRVSPEPELRHSARSSHRASMQQSAAEAEATAERLRKAEARERQQEKSRKEVAAAEELLQGAAHMELKHNIKKLNKVWVHQQGRANIPGVTPPAGLAPAGMAMEQEVRYHNGVKYERKSHGPFQGKLTSQAQILNIDGEDYVEYRILTKPSFF